MCTEQDQEDSQELRFAIGGNGGGSCRQDAMRPQGNGGTRGGSKFYEDPRVGVSLFCLLLGTHDGVP